MNDTHLALMLCALLFLLAGCASVVPSTRDIKTPLESKGFGVYNRLDSPLALPYLKELAQEGTSGAMLVSDGSYALLHRAHLVRQAKFSLEIQTYIYKNDIASRVLMHEIWQAANRGVLVKILVDDNGLDSDYSDIITLNNHPNIEVKIFNPYRNRIKLFRLPEMVFHFNRINRRMPNKLFIADGIALIIGGRNIADNYFDNKLDVNFSDTDAFFIGDVAVQARKSFKRYWEYHRAIPVEFLPSKRKMKKFMKNYNEMVSDLEVDSSEWERYSHAMEDVEKQYENRVNAMYWGHAYLVADDPEKIDAKNPASKIYEELQRILADTNDSIYISSAYLVPGKRGLAQMQDAIEKGINLYVLTNSLSSTDSLPVYAGWERYRDKLVKMGAEVYEYRKGAGKIKVRGRMTSGASLHSKTLVFDNKISWIGSFNLDPRSSIINTEVVAIFDNEEFAKETTKLIHIDMQRAWHLELDKRKIKWCARSDPNGEGIEDMCVSRSPDTSLWLRFLNILMRIFPENQI